MTYLYFRNHFKGTLKWQNLFLSCQGKRILKMVSIYDLCICTVLTYHLNVCLSGCIYIDAWIVFTLSRKSGLLVLQSASLIIVKLPKDEDSVQLLQNLIKSDSIVYCFVKFTFKFWKFEWCQVILLHTSLSQ